MTIKNIFYIFIFTFIFVIMNFTNTGKAAITCANISIVANNSDGYIQEMADNLSGWSYTYTVYNTGIADGTVGQNYIKISDSRAQRKVYRAFYSFETGYFIPSGSQIFNATLCTNFYSTYFDTNSNNRSIDVYNVYIGAGIGTEDFNASFSASAYKENSIRTKYMKTLNWVSGNGTYYDYGYHIPVGSETYCLYGLNPEKINLSSNNSNTTYELMVNDDEIFNISFDAGAHYYRINTNDQTTDGNNYKRPYLEICYNETTGNTSDTTKPILTFISPTPAEKSTYSADNNPKINVSIIETNPDKCIFYRNDTGTNTTISISGGICNYSLLNLSNGTYLINVFANDTSGNMNGTTRIFNVYYSENVTAPPPSGTCGNWICYISGGYNVTSANFHMHVNNSIGSVNLYDWLFLGYSLWGAGNAAHTTDGTIYHEMYKKNDTNRSLDIDAIIHIDNYARLSLMYNDSSVAFFMGRYNSTAGKKHLEGNWIYAFSRDKNRVIVIESKRQTSSVYGALSNNQFVNFHNKAYFELMYAGNSGNYTGYDGEKIDMASQNYQVPVFAPIQYGNKTEFQGYGFYNESMNISIGGFVTGADEYQYSSLSQYSSWAYNDAQQSSEKQYNYFGSADNGMIDFYAPFEWNFLETQLLTGNGNQNDIIYNEAKKYYTPYFDEITGYDIKSTMPDAHGRIYTTLSKLANYDYSSGMKWFVPYHSRAVWFSEGITMINGTSNTYYHPAVIPVSNMKFGVYSITRGNGYKESYADSNDITGLFNYSINHTIFNDSDKIIYKINITLNKNYNMSSLYFTFKPSNNPAFTGISVKDVTENLSDFRFIDNNLGDWSFSLINETMPAKKEIITASNTINFYFFNGTNSEHAAGEKYNITLMLVSHSGNWTNDAAITPLHYDEPIISKIFYRKFIDLNNASFAIRPHENIIDFGAAAYGNKLSFYMFALNGNYEIKYVANYSDAANVTHIKIDGATIPAGSWNGDNRTKKIILNFTAAGDDNITLIETYFSSSAPYVPPPAPAIQLNVTSSCDICTAIIPEKIRLCDGDTMRIIHEREICESGTGTCKKINQTDFKVCAYGCMDNATSSGAMCKEPEYMQNFGLFAVAGFVFLIIFAIIPKIFRKKRRW